MGISLIEWEREKNNRYYYFYIDFQWALLVGITLGGLSFKKPFDISFAILIPFFMIGFTTWKTEELKEEEVYYG